MTKPPVNNSTRRDLGRRWGSTLNARLKVIISEDLGQERSKSVRDDQNHFGDKPLIVAVLYITSLPQSCSWSRVLTNEFGGNLK